MYTLKGILDNNRTPACVQNGLGAKFELAEMLIIFIIISVGSLYVRQVCPVQTPGMLYFPSCISRYKLLEGLVSGRNFLSHTCSLILKTWHDKDY